MFSITIVEILIAIDCLFLLIIGLNTLFIFWCLSRLTDLVRESAVEVAEIKQKMERVHNSVLHFNNVINHLEEKYNLYY